jgi:GDP-L-fucose synthase
MKVLVTGGTGFLGKRIQKQDPGWIYISSESCDLTDPIACYDLFKNLKPDAIVHLAGKVGGVKENTSKQAEYYYQNTMINTNVIHQAYRTGVERVLSSLSTCCFPDKVEVYPFTEQDMFSGPPAKSNLSYGYAKRSLHVQSLSYRKQYGLNYSTFCPSNIYGPHDHFDDENSHFVAALVSKVYNSVNGDELEFWGSGRPLRQQLYVDDLVKALPVLLERHKGSSPIIVAPNENLSISEMIEIALKVSGKELNIAYNNSFEGQYRKDGSNKRFLELMDGFEFTSFEEGFEKTYKWYKEYRG